MECRMASRDLQSWSFPLERPKSLAAVNALLGEILDGPGEPPSAIFVPADSIAVLLYRAIAERGLCIPDDLSVISVNREEGLIAGLFPTLTTIDIRSEEIGREAVALLGRKLASEEASSPQNLLLSHSLVAGESVSLTQPSSA